MLQHSLLRFAEVFLNAGIKAGCNSKINAARVMHPRVNSHQMLEGILRQLVTPKLPLPPSAMAGQVAWKSASSSLTQGYQL